MDAGVTATDAVVTAMDAGVTAMDAGDMDLEGLGVVTEDVIAMCTEFNESWSQCEKLVTALPRSLPGGNVRALTLMLTQMNVNVYSNLAADKAPNSEGLDSCELVYDPKRKKILTLLNKHFFTKAEKRMELRNSQGANDRFFLDWERKGSHFENSVSLYFIDEDSEKKKARTVTEGAEPAGKPTVKLFNTGFMQVSGLHWLDEVVLLALITAGFALEAMAQMVEINRACVPLPALPKLLKVDYAMINCSLDMQFSHPQLTHINLDILHEMLLMDKRNTFHCDIEYRGEEKLNGKICPITNLMIQTGTLKDRVTVKLYETGRCVFIGWTDIDAVLDILTRLVRIVNLYHPRVLGAKELKC